MRHAAAVVLVKVGRSRVPDANVLRDELRRLVIGGERRAGELGISGVPFFVVDRAWAVSGAQPSEAWIDALGEIRARAAPAAAPAK